MNTINKIEVSQFIFKFVSGGIDQTLLVEGMLRKWFFNRNDIVNCPDDCWTYDYKRSYDHIWYIFPKIKEAYYFRGRKITYLHNEYGLWLRMDKYEDEDDFYRKVIGECFWIVLTREHYLELEKYKSDDIYFEIECEKKKFEEAEKEEE